MKMLAAFLMVAAAFGARPAPRLLATAEDFARMARLAERAPWAAAARAAIAQNAGNWPSAQMTRYGLKEWAVPPEGGQCPYCFSYRIVLSAISSLIRMRVRRPAFSSEPGAPPCSCGRCLSNASM